MLNHKLLRAVLRNTGLARATWGFLATFVAASALLALVDPGVDGFGDALWCCFQAVTTIGYGDITVTSAVGRMIVVALSVVGILFVAVLATRAWPCTWTSWSTWTSCRRRSWPSSRTGCAGCAVRGGSATRTRKKLFGHSPRLPAADYALELLLECAAAFSLA